MPKFALAKPQQGSLAEWLGTGLQNRLQQFDSARNLKNDARFGGHCCFRACFIINIKSEVA